MIVGGQKVIDYTYVIDDASFNVDPELLYNLDKSFRTYEGALLTYIRKGEITDAEEVLLEFCMKIVQLPEREQLFVARLFFTSFVTKIIRKQNRNGRLPSNMLANAYDLIYQIEQWENISEYMLHISTFIKQIKSNIILEHLLFRGNALVSEALTIIYTNLQSNELTVNSIAEQLDVSPTHLTNLFKEHLDQTPSEYIAQKKMKAIIYELNHTNESLHTIRERFGFHNHSHFIQFFKKHTNLTPLQYLQQYVY